MWSYISNNGENKMNVQNKQEKELNEKVNQILSKAKEEDEVFLVTLTPQQLKQTGFEEDDDFFDFEYVFVYLQYDDQYRFKYKFNGDPSNTLYESVDDIGSFKDFVEVLRKYLSFRQY